MRVLPLLLVVGVSACFTADPTQSKADAGDAGGQCDNKDDCQSCLNCALTEPCAALYSACLNDTDCTFVDSCVGGCVDPACQQSCYATNPAGAAQYRGVKECMYCEQCVNDCSGAYTCS